MDRRTTEVKLNCVSRLVFEQIWLLYLYQKFTPRHPSYLKEICFSIQRIMLVTCQLFRCSYVKDSASFFTSLKGRTFCECKVYLSSSLVPKCSSVHVHKAERTPNKTCNVLVRNYCRFVHKYSSELKTRSLATTQDGHPRRGQQQQMPYRIYTFSFA